MVGREGRGPGAGNGTGTCGYENLQELLPGCELADPPGINANGIRNGCLGLALEGVRNHEQ